MEPLGNALWESERRERRKKERKLRKKKMTTWTGGGLGTDVKLHQERRSIGGCLEEDGVWPLDEANARMLDLCAPRMWINPVPAEDFVYDLVAIGAGAGGLVSSKQTARRGYKSALIEQHIAGGDCLVVGCVPSKALLASAKAASLARNAETLGVDVTDVKVNFERVMERMRECRARIAPADSYEGAQKLGVDVFQGRAKFVGPHTVEVGGQTLRFRKAVIATGARAALPQDLNGLENVNYFTNANIFNLTKLPDRLLIIGGGPIGVELGQAFASLGSKVTMLIRGSRILSSEDPEVSELLMNRLMEEGITIATNLTFKSIEPLIYTEKDEDGNGAKVRATRHDEKELVFAGDAVLVSVGRAPNVSGMGLEKAGVVFDERNGVKVDEFLRTSNPDILAVGDVCSAAKFTHVSGTQAQMAVENALFAGQMNSAQLLVPHVTYCEPEVATVGLTESQAEAQGVKVEVYRSTFEHNDRAILDGTAHGFCKVLVKEGSDEIVGATIVSHSAGELISEVTLAIQFGIGLGFEDGIGSVIHSYPTMAEGVAGCAFGFKLKHWKMAQVDGTVQAKDFHRVSASKTISRGGTVRYGTLIGWCSLFALAGFAVGAAIRKS